MTPSAIVDELLRRGASAEVLVDGRLRVAPASVLDGALLGELRAHREELRAFLAERRDAGLREQRLLRGGLWLAEPAVCSFLIGHPGEDCKRCGASWMEHYRRQAGP